MLSLEERMNMTELLSGLSLEDILSLSFTITNGLLKPSTKEEANEAILQHSNSVESILNRQKVTKELIFSYLHWKKVNTGKIRDKKSLTNLLTKYWKEQLQAGVKTENGQIYSTNTSITEPSNSQQVNQNSNGTVSIGLEPGQADLLAFKFSEWFYQLLNKDFLQGGNFAMGSEHFWNDATLHMQLNSNEGTVTEETEGNQSVVDLIKETKQRHKLYFSPNLSAEGIRGRSEPHGMVSVLVCGTLHQSAGVVVGIFEQIFYLVKDPLMNNNWKVKRTQLNLTSKTNIAALPTLSQGCLTGPLLPIENPD